MSRFSDKTDTLSLHAPWWDDDEVVHVKRIMSFADRRAIQAATMRLSAHQSQESGITAELSDFDPAAGTRETLLRMIVSWTFCVGADLDRQPVVLSAEAIDQLADEDVSYIKAEIDKLNPTRSSADERSFDGASDVRLRVMDRRQRASS